MSLLVEYRDARRGEDVARLRRVLALRAMLATGMSQRQVAEGLGVSQSAISQQLKFAPALDGVHPEVLLEAAAPVLRVLAEDRGFAELAVFGSVSRKQARPDSDIDLLVKAPANASSFDLVALKLLLEQVLDRSVDLIDYGGLRPGLDEDIRGEAVLL
ncbi:Cro/Cl family transcriptional regulator [Pseudactinotalea sp. HY160]|uniref:nucleotidyltransferase domain-containing protein n=1 Tax=Pseudactinotalea sp. HY160 TaxID=2654490 RepID=UPI00128E1466|nr:nucleotidyltransferase domain-containing protein [Pseudactinotalea sp. HY160]MPV49034.1 Cro/Cl family transcriptional regulator [Pseudactinotalea sp. HY160]